MEHLLRLRLDVRAAERLVLCVGFEVFRALDVAGLFERVQLFLQLRDVARAASGDVEHGLGTDAFGLLRQVADHRPSIALDSAGVRILLVQDDGEERGLARAVRADECDALAVVHLQRGVLKERAPAVAFSKIANGEHGIKCV